MARLAYNVLLWLALPLVLVRLAWRARRQPGYLEHLGERLGAAPRLTGSPVIWIPRFRSARPARPRRCSRGCARIIPCATILLTHMTPTGRATGRELFGDAVTQSWLPWDHGPFVRRFLGRARPDFGVLLETEIWPNLLAECRGRGIPVFLVNARLSARSAAGYARLAPLAREALGNLAGIAAQTAADAGRLEALGARDVAVTGNIKFDLAVPEDTLARGEALRDLFGRSRRVWVAGSTREGEEELIVEAVEAAGPPEDVLVVIVPRHPQRFEPVAGLLAARGRPVARRSLGTPVPPEARYALASRRRSTSAVASRLRPGGRLPDRPRGPRAG